MSIFLQIKPCQNQGSCTDGLDSYECSCIGTGYSGTDCETLDGVCHSSPCLHDGVCLDRGTVEGPYACDCTAVDYAGITCELWIDDCAGVACEHGGTCVDGVRSYACDCDATGYTGNHCELVLPTALTVP